MQHQKPSQCLLVAVAVAIVVLSTCCCTGRELRPSDHGLTYQENPFLPGETDQARSFFGPSTTTTTTTTTTMTPPAIPLPLAQNISEGTWMDQQQNGAKSREGGKIDHVKMGLIVASAVCGLTGIVLLLVSGIIFLLRVQKRRINGTATTNGKEGDELKMSAVTLASKSHANGDNNNNNNK